MSEADTLPRDKLIPSGDTIFAWIQEVFTQGGQRTITDQVFPAAGAGQVALFADGPTTIRGVAHIRACWSSPASSTRSPPLLRKLSVPGVCHCSASRFRFRPCVLPSSLPGRRPSCAVAVGHIAASLVKSRPPLPSFAH